MSTTTIGAGSDTLSLGISEDYFLGNAQFTIALDGQQVGGTLTAQSLNYGPTADTVNVLADLDTGIHTVTVNFLNDAYSGVPQGDRNLYIEGATYDGAFIVSAARELKVNGPVTFGFIDNTPLPSTTTIGSGSDTLVLKVSQDAYLGNARFTVSLDGQQVGDVLTASALHSGGSSDTVNVLADLAPGKHTVLVNFLNDVYDGTPATDRNLYVDSATYDGQPVEGATLALLSSGVKTFSISDGTYNPTSLAVAGGTTATAQGDQLAGVAVDLVGSQGSPANVTLDSATIGSLKVVDADLTDGSSVRYGHLDVYGQSAVSGNITLGGDRPVAPGFLDGYIHGSDGVFTLHGATLGGSSTLKISGDAGSAVENDGDIRIRGGTTTGGVSILTDLQGTGTISGGQDVAGDPASILLGGAVGSGETISLTHTNLTLDQPMRFAGTLEGFTSDGVPGFSRGSLILDHETVTGTSFAQSSAGLGDLSVFTQDQETGAAGATLAFHVAGTLAPDAFTFTNNAAAQSAAVYLT